MNKTNTLFAALAIAAAAATTQAQTYITSVNAGTSATAPAAGSAIIGSTFGVTGAGITVTSLGFLDAGAAGISGNAIVSIHSFAGGGSFGPALVTATISSASTASGGFLWENHNQVLGPGFYGILLTGGTLDGSDPIGDIGLGDTAATYANSGNVFLSGFDAPVFGTTLSSLTMASGDRWKVVNFAYTPVPEPETYAMIAGVGLVAFGLWRRRQ